MNPTFVPQEGFSLKVPQDVTAPWITTYQETRAGRIPVITTRLTAEDRWGALGVRLGYKRMRYAVPAGLYAVGNPRPVSPLLVTANYKLTFDTVRRELTGVDAWLLVLDTKGVNVWCAAGKGTFGTAELIKRVQLSRVADLVSHRTLILPQLGASGVSAHEVSQATGLRVVYGPVRARDIPAFLKAGNQKTPEMARVTFTLAERMAVAPLELVQSLPWMAVVLGITAVFALVAHRGPTWAMVTDPLLFAGAAVTGALAFPALLPFLPFRAFSLKGLVLGALYTAVVALVAGISGWELVYLGLTLPALVAYMALNFTGSSTYTSLAGTKKEVALGLPLMALSVGLGILVKMGVLVVSFLR